MIRLSVKTDFSGIFGLWKDTFHDDDTIGRMFYHSRYIPENTVVAEEDGEIISMLFLLEGKLKINGRYYSSYYLYAAATAEKYRGNGYMSKLLAYAENLALSRNIDFICLKPAEDSLYGFYSRFGYKPVFTVSRIKINNFDYPGFYVSSGFNSYDCCRNSIFTDYDSFVWDNSAIDFAFKHHCFYGGKILSDCNGYCLYNVEDNKCTVKEFCFTADLLRKVVSYLKNNNSFDEIIIDLPVGYLTDIQGKIINNGMALAVTDTAKSLIDNISNAYLNLTLD